MANPIDRELFDRLRAGGLRKSVARVISEATATGKGASGHSRRPRATRSRSCAAWLTSSRTACAAAPRSSAARRRRRRRTRASARRPRAAPPRRRLPPRAPSARRRGRRSARPPRRARRRSAPRRPARHTGARRRRRSPPSARASRLAGSAQRPVVHGLVGVHVLAVAQRHLAQRVGAVELAVVVEAVEGLRPATSRRCGASTQRRSMMPSRRSRSARVDAPALEALVGERQQPAQHELGDRDLAEPRPVDARVDPVARAGVEVLLGGARTTSATTPAAPRRRARARARSRRRRWRGCRRPSGRRAARGSRRAGAGGRARRRRSGGSSGRRCRCAGAARAGAGTSPRSSIASGSSSSAHRQQRREVADVLLEEVEDRR